MAPHPFFAGMCDQHIRLLAEAAHLARFPKGSFVFREGELANRFYLIHDGKVALESSAAENSSIPLQVLSSGDVLGWSWLFPPSLWHFDARALEETNAVFLSGMRLRELCETDKAFGYEIMRRVAEVVVRRLQATRLSLVDTFNSASRSVGAGEPFRRPSPGTPSILKNEGP